MRARIEALAAAFVDELRVMQATLHEKGFNRFARAIGVSGIVAFGSYMSIYTAPQRRMEGLRAQLRKGKMLATFANDYKRLRERLREINAALPAGQDTGDWLTDTLVEAMKAENIIPDSISPPETWQNGGFTFRSVSVTMTVHFPEVVAWVRRVEGAKPLLHVSQLLIEKDKRRIGIAKVTCVVTSGSASAPEGR